jgi:hypothetical protein
MWVLGLSSSLISVACTIKTDNVSDAKGGSGGGAGTGSGGLASSGGTSSSDGGDGGSESEGGSVSEGGRVSAGGSSSGGSGGGTGGPTRVLFDCKSRDVTSAKVVTGAIKTDETWSGTVYLKNSVSLEDGATLTIEAGTQVVMGPDAEFRMGWNLEPATVKAVGTAANPIRFCGEQGDAGFWRQIFVEKNVTSNSQLHHVLISDAGAMEQALRLDADIDIQNVQVRNSQKNGVLAEDFKAGSTELSVEGAGGTAVVLTSSNAIEHFPVGGAFKNNKSNVLAIDFDSIVADARFQNVGIPYYQKNQLDVYRAKVTFDPGVLYQFDADAGLEIGWNGYMSSISAVGTEKEPIVFDGVTAKSGHWQGITIQTQVTSDSTLSNVEIRHGGGNSSFALQVRAPITLDGVLVSDNDAGVFIGEKGLSKDSKNLTVTKGAERPLTVQPDGLISLPEGGTFTGNAIDEVAIDGDTYRVSGTIPNLGIPYRFLSSVDTMKGSSMTLTAGSEFILPSDAHLAIGWNGSESSIVAAGTAAKPIRFRGSESTSGYWEGLIIGDNVPSASKLDYVEVSGGQAACATLRSSIPVTHSTFSKCTGYGVLKKTADTRDYETGNTFTAVGTGNVGTL